MESRLSPANSYDSENLTMEESRINNQIERMRIRREERATLGLDEANEEEEHKSKLSPEHSLAGAATTYTSPQLEGRHLIVVEAAPLPPVFSMPELPDSDSEYEENLTEIEKEKRAKLQRMEERRLRKHAEEEALGSYVDVSSSSYDDEKKSFSSIDSETVNIHESHAPLHATTTAPFTNASAATSYVASDIVSERDAALPVVRIVLPPESARPKQRPSSALMSAVVKEGLLGLTLTFKTGIPISLVAPLDCSIIVRVHAASINPVDYKLPKLIGGPGVGLDFSGVVIAVRPDTTSFKEGDEVYGNAQGTLAEYVVCEANKINLKPTHLSFVESAAMPTAYLTALQGLRKYIKKDDHVLVIGASGGCGLAAIHVARILGASEIVAVCSAKNVKLVKQQGATRVIDYTAESVSSVYQKWQISQQFYDIVFDAATGSGGKEDYYEEAQKVLKPNGKLVCLNGSVGVWLRKFTKYQRVNQDLILTEHSSVDLGVLTHMVDSSEQKGDPGIRPVIGCVLSFNEHNVKIAFDLLKSRRATGKIILQMIEDSGSHIAAAVATSSAATSNTLAESPS